MEGTEYLGLWELQGSWETQGSQESSAEAATTRRRMVGLECQWTVRPELLESQGRRGSREAEAMDGQSGAVEVWVPWMASLGTLETQESQEDRGSCGAVETVAAVEVAPHPGAQGNQVSWGSQARLGPEGFDR